MIGSLNDPDDPRAPDPDAAVPNARTEGPAGGHDASDEDAKASLPPGADTKPGPGGDDARAQPYEEQPVGLRMHDDD